MILYKNKNFNYFNFHKGGFSNFRLTDFETLAEGLANGAKALKITNIRQGAAVFIMGTYADIAVRKIHEKLFFDVRKRPDQVGDLTLLIDVSDIDGLLIRIRKSGYLPFETKVDLSAITNKKIQVIAISTVMAFLDKTYYTHSAN